MGGGLTGPVPRDIWWLLGTVFVTFSMSYFSSTAWIPQFLRLTPAVWGFGFVWQLVTYPFVGTGAPGFWFVLELLILFMFGRDIFLRLGQRGFWRLLVYSGGVAALAAVLVALVGHWIVGSAVGGGNLFVLLQGQHMLLVILIAAFATLNAEATILLFFVLPIRASWFLGLEVVFGFLGFLSTRDLAGFVGICVAIGFTYGHLTRWRGSGPRMWRLRFQQWWLKARLSWMRKKSGLRVVKGGKDPGQGPWLHRDGLRRGGAAP